MTDEEKRELQILNISYTLISKMVSEQLKGLTDKALSLTIDEKSRVAVLGGRNELINFHNGLNERRNKLTALLNKEAGK